MAKREIDAQDNHLNHLELLLRREREARESAEECARRLLESRHSLPNGGQEHRAVEEAASEPPASSPMQPNSNLANGCPPGSGNASPSHEITPITCINPTNQASVELQRDIDLVDTPGPLEKLNSLVREMEEMRLVMERYKQRAEGAEHERNGLVKMVEWIRATAPIRSDSSAAIPVSNNEAYPQFSVVEKSVPCLATVGQKPSSPSPSSPVPKRPPLENGVFLNDITAHGIKERPYTLSVIPQSQFHGERSRELTMPYMSMVGVLLVGVGIMTWLNGWQKGER